MLLLRLNKAAPLTNAELDNNLIYLDDRCSGLEFSKLSTVDLLNHIKFVGGLGSGIDADKLDGKDSSSQALNNTIVARDASGNFNANVITATLVGNASSANTAQTLSGIVSIVNGGTGATSLVPGYIKSDGNVLSSVNTINAPDVIGNIPGNSVNVTGVVGIANGGTGASTPNEARNALGIVIGQTVQSYSNNLTLLSGVSSSGLLMFGAGIIATRQLVTGNCLSLANPDGVAGNPTISISNVDIAHGGTGANTPTGALAALGAAAATDAVLNGTPTAPTAANGTNTNQLATTSFVINNSVPPGTILTIVGNSAPSGYLLANGAEALRISYPVLYARIGPFVGSGNGTTTFTLPNFPVAAGYVAIIKT